MSRSRGVVATAGHVDHGKSSLVQALTGMDPDRWQEEKRRGLTLDLGYAWWKSSQGPIAVVDVPGHERFVDTMVAGVSPVAVVLLVIAVDEGWSAQTEEHVAIMHACGVQHVVVALTKCDLADAAPMQRDVSQKLAVYGYHDVPLVPVSARTGQGLNVVREAVEHACDTATHSGETTRVWVDRSFVVTGAGTVVTGTLVEGAVTLDDQLTLVAPGAEPRPVSVRGLQSLGHDHSVVTAPARVALSLRAVSTSECPRGSWLGSAQHGVGIASADIRWDDAQRALAAQVTAHVGTAQSQARVRRLGERSARLTLTPPLPLRSGDRLVMRTPGDDRAPWGATVVVTDPPPLRRRGAAARWGRELEACPMPVPWWWQVQRHGWLPATDAPPSACEDTQVVRLGAWWTTPEEAARAAREVKDAVQRQAHDQPRQPWLSVAQAAHLASIPSPELVPLVVQRAVETDAPTVVAAEGRVSLCGVCASLGSAEQQVHALERRLQAQPWDAPETAELHEAGLDDATLATAAALGRLLVLPGPVVVLPTAPALAMRELAALPQPFTVSAARQAWGTTRRVAIPLLEHLDARGWTKREGGSLRRVVRG